MVAAVLLGLIALAALAAPLIAPQNPFDLASFDVLDADLPPRWLAGSDPRFLLGTDSPGRLDRHAELLEFAALVGRNQRSFAKLQWNAG